MEHRAGGGVLAFGFPFKFTARCLKSPRALTKVVIMLSINYLAFQHNIWGPFPLPHNRELFNSAHTCMEVPGRVSPRCVCHNVFLVLKELPEISFVLVNFCSGDRLLTTGPLFHQLSRN